MKSRVLDIRNFVCIITTLISVGCATMKPPPQYKPTQFLMHQESDGIKVFIEPFVDKKRIKKYFGTDLIAKGIFPFYVRIVNGLKDTSIFVDESTFSLVLETGNAKSVETKEIQSVSAGENLSLVGACCISIPCMLMGGKIAGDASVINYNFNQNKLQATTISPGKNASGFVYFSLPDKGTIPKSWKIMASVENFSDNKKTKFIF